MLGNHTSRHDSRLLEDFVITARHYNVLGMTIPTMQQAGMPVVSMNQGMPVGSIPQQISMVQQLNPVS